MKKRLVLLIVVFSLLTMSAFAEDQSDNAQQALKQTIVKVKIPMPDLIVRLDSHTRVIKAGETLTYVRVRAINADTGKAKQKPVW